MQPKYAAGDSLIVSGLEFFWNEEYDNLSFERISINNVLTEEEVEELAEFCISYQNRVTPEMERKKTIERLKWQIEFLKQDIKNANYKITKVPEWEEKIKEFKKELKELDE